MGDWKKKETPEDSLIYEYGDGDGNLLYRLYCVESEDAIDKMVPDALFFGDSVLPDPSVREIKTLIETENMFDSDVVVCSVVERCKDPDCSDIVIENGECYWKIS